MNETRLLNSGGKMLAKRWFKWYSPEKLTLDKSKGKDQEDGDVIHLVSLVPQTANCNLEHQNQVAKFRQA